MEKLADWIGWFLQFLAGAFVGAFVGVVSVFHQGRYHFVSCSPWLAGHLVLPYFIGVALVGGAFGSYYGDRLWLSQSNLLIPPAEPTHTVPRTALSIALGLSGALAVAYAVGKNFGLLSF